MIQKLDSERGHPLALLQNAPPQLVVEEMNLFGHAYPDAGARFGYG